MIEDKDFIVKELKKAIQALNKISQLYKEERYIDLQSTEDESIEISTLENLLQQDKIKQKEFELAKTILLAQFYKLKALKQTQNNKNYASLYTKWNCLLEQTIDKSGTFDFELMDVKEKLNLLN